MRRELLFEREQLPQVIDNRHFRIELMERLEPVIILRNQQVTLRNISDESIANRPPGVQPRRQGWR